MIKDCRIRSRKVSLKEVERPTTVAREQKLTKVGRRKVGVVDVNRRIRIARRARLSLNFLDAWESHLTLTSLDHVILRR
jgi:hypothetical protein